MKQVNCSCNGLNENCYNCQGAGYFLMKGSNISDTGVTISKNRNLSELYIPNSNEISVLNPSKLIDNQKPKENKKNENTISIKSKVQKGLNIAHSEGKKTIIVCKNCGAEILERKLYQHKKKCKKTAKKAKDYNKNKNDIRYNLSTPIESSKNTPKYKQIIKPNIEVFNSKLEYKEERKLDGSRDYYTFKEQGKFGSHSVFDDMNDESFS